MAKRSPLQFHPFWGVFTDAGDLPNVLGAGLQSAYLEIGDLAYLDGVGLHQCDDGTLGAAVWSQVGSGGGSTGFQSSIDLPRKDYVQQPVPVEEVLGQFMFDGSTIPVGASVFLRCLMNPAFSVAGTANVHVYDLGPAAGPPVAPVRITGTGISTFALEASASGLVYKQTAALALGPGPAEGVIMSAPRMYEVTIIQSSAPADTVDVGMASIFTEI